MASQTVTAQNVIPFPRPASPARTAEAQAAEFVRRFRADPIPELAHVSDAHLRDTFSQISEAMDKGRPRSSNVVALRGTAAPSSSLPTQAPDEVRIRELVAVLQAALDRPRDRRERDFARAFARAFPHVVDGGLGSD